MNNEIIDAEVVEEVVETIPMEEVEYSDEEIDAMLVTLKCAIQEKDNLRMNELAKKMAINSKDYLDNDTYLWVMYAYSLRYLAEENTNAARYCYIRMKDVLEATIGKRKKQKALTFIDTTLPTEVITKVYEETEFMVTTLAKVRNQFLMMQVFLVAMFFVLIHFILGYDVYLAVFFSLGLFFLNVKLTFTNIKNKYIQSQTDASKSYSEDDELFEFDLPVKMS